MCQRTPFKKKKRFGRVGYFPQLIMLIAELQQTTLLVAVATLEMVLWVGWLVGWLVGW